jgi:hypothetical protein
VTTEVPEQTTFGLCATEIGVQAHHIERLAARGKIRFTRAGRIRLVLVSDFPAIRAACVAAGYLKVPTEAVANAPR